MRNSAQIILFFLLSAVIGIAALYVLFSMDIPQWSSVQAARLQVAQRQAVRDQVANLISQFQERVAQFANLDQQISLISSALPSSMNIPELLATVESMASKSKVSLDQISFTSVAQPQQTMQGAAVVRTQQQKPFRITVSMTVSGGYSAIKDFAAAIETEVRLLDTNVMTMMPVSGAAKQAQFSSHIEATAYYIAQPSFTLP